MKDIREQRKYFIWWIAMGLKSRLKFHDFGSSVKTEGNGQV